MQGEMYMNSHRWNPRNIHLAHMLYSVKGLFKTTVNDAASTQFIYPV